MSNKSTDVELFAPCGVNCMVCDKHCRYERPCKGCLSYDENTLERGPRCRIKDCASSRGVTYCFECPSQPCKMFGNRERSYNERYQVSPTENGNYAKQYGIKAFMDKQRDKYTCPQCGGVICIDERKCSECQAKME